MDSQHWSLVSVGLSVRDATINYIRGQATHHLELSFQDEFRGFYRGMELPGMNNMFGVKVLRRSAGALELLIAVRRLVIAVRSSPIAVSSASANH